MPRNHAAVPWRDRDAAGPSFSPLCVVSDTTLMEGRSQRLQTLQAQGGIFSSATGGEDRRPRAEARLFLLLRVVVSACPTAAVGGVHTAAAGLTVPLSLAVSILIAALLLVAALTLVVSHVRSSLLWVGHRTEREAATPVPVISAHEQEQRAALALNL